MFLQHFFDERKYIPDLVTMMGPMPNEHILHIRALHDQPLPAKDAMQNFAKAFLGTCEALRDQDHKKLYELMVQGAECTAC